MSADLITFPFIDQAYESISAPFSAQQLINMYLEDAQVQARSQRALIGTPGLEEFVQIGTGPIRGLHVFREFLYAVSEFEVFKIDVNGIATKIGDIPRTTRVSIENNETQVCFVNGNEGFIYTPASDTFEEILDPDFRPAQLVQFLDGYFVFNDPLTNEFFISNFQNGLAYTGTDFGVAEGSPDLIISILSDHRDLFLFGERSTELWNNTGNPDFTFEVQEGVFIERGCAAANSVVKMDNQVYWLGDDRAVYRLDGYLPAKVSTHAIDTQIRRYDIVADAFAFTYTEDGHFFYVLTFPRANETWVYDSAPKGGAWHQRSTGINEERWRANNYARLFNKNIIGDFQTNQLFEMDLETYAEDGDEILRVRSTMPESADERPIFFSKLQVTLDSGQGNLVPPSDNPLAQLSWSDDGGRTFTSPRFREMGKIGEYGRRVIWRKLGRFRNRVYKWACSEKIKVVVISTAGEFEQGF